MEQISFILGAGFSVPEKYPTRDELNKKLVKIKEDEIYFDTSLTAGFLKGDDDPNPWSNEIYKKFIQQFLKFYYDEFNVFDYEDFYDYYQSLLNGYSKSESFTKFFLKFLLENELEEDSHSSSNLLAYFNIAFNQLLHEALGVKWPKYVSYDNNCFPNYITFLKMINYFKNEGLVNIHSLNHDLLIEILSHTEAFSFDFCDGYIENGSPYYGDCYIDRMEYKYKIRLKYFDDFYPNKIRFYKLHGSVDSYVFDDDSIKIQKGVSTNSFYKEVEEKNLFKYIENSFNHYPDFLSGSIEKTKKYNLRHYKTIFEHFEENLLNSRKLIIIGYSFGDTVINKFIKDYFLSNEKASMLIIDVKQNDNMNKFLELNNVEFVPKSISEITLKEIDEKLDVNIEQYFSEMDRNEKDRIKKLLI